MDQGTSTTTTGGATISAPRHDPGWSMLAGRRPNVAVSATLGLVVSVAGALVWGLLDAASTARFIHCTGEWLMVNLVSLAVALAVVAAGAHLYSTHPGPTAPSRDRTRASYATYTVAGLVGGVVRVLCLRYVPLDEGPLDSPYHAAGIVLVTVLVVLTIGTRANAMGNLAERATKVDAELQVRVEQLESALADLDRCREGLVGADEGLRKDTSEWINSRLQARLLTTEVQLGMAAALVANDPDAAATEIDRLRGDLAQVRNTELRVAADRLHPAIVSVGLVPAVNKLAADHHGAGSGTDLRVKVTPAVHELDDLGAGHLPERLRLSAYRVVEESVRNAVQHGEAGTVDVHLDHHGGHLVVEVTDDGTGFEPGHRTGGGLGLHSMEARVRSFGGHFGVRSARGAGTTVRATFPVAAPAAVDLTSDAASTPAASS